MPPRRDMPDRALCPPDRRSVQGGRSASPLPIGRASFRRWISARSEDLSLVPIVTRSYPSVRSVARHFFPLAPALSRQGRGSGRVKIYEDGASLLAHWFRLVLLQFTRSSPMEGR